MKTLTTFLTEAVTVKVQTHSKGYEAFSSSDLKDMLNNPADYSGADNLPKWISMAVAQQFKMGSAKNKLVSLNVLKAIASGKIKKIDFYRNANGMIIGFKDLNLKAYI